MALAQDGGVAMIDPLPGDIFRKGELLNNTYEIEGVLGRGGTGEVYCARNQITGRVVAIKALNRAFSTNAGYLELMKREEEMRSISHDAVVRYTDCNLSGGGHVYLVMDYVDGTPLSDWLERGGARPRDLLIVAHRVAEGLVATHAAGIVHRDLSPDNIILRGGEPEQAVIIDFGIAKDMKAGARTIVGHGFAGKYEYAAPEQLHGRAEARSDLYALGASLLATYRGRVPDVAGSPGEILRAKEQRLDTTGVPEPLKTLIDDLTQPDPARRPPSAAVVVAAVEAMLQAPAAAPGRKPRRLWLAAIPVAAAAAGAAALWLTGALHTPRGPELDPVSPYTLTAEAGDGEARLTGFSPDQGAREAVLAAFRDAAGAEAGADAIELAAGAPTSDWGSDVAGFLSIAGELETWRVELADDAVTLSGVAEDAALRSAVVDRFAGAADAAGYRATTQVAAGPRRLDQDRVAAFLAAFSDCGPLTAVPPDGDAYELGDVVRVTGAVPDAESLDLLRAALAPRLGDRLLRLEAVVLNEPLCQVQSVLPRVPPGTLTIALGYGDRDLANLSGIYGVGDNPTIDILLPADVDEGYLWVAIADVAGDVFNILPNTHRPEHRIVAAGTVEDGVRDIRLAYSLAEQAAVPERVAFTVDETFGKSQIIVFHTDRPLFPELRPTIESASSFAEDLADVLAAGEVTVHSVTTRLLASRS
jgi:eukaryotic-like serine/threonine-protein kinase